MNKDVVVRLRMTQKEAEDFNKKVAVTGLTKSAFIRVLIAGYIPKPKPDKEFYVLLCKLYAVCNDMNQLTAKAHTLNFIDISMLKDIKTQHQNLLDEIQKKYLAPDKNKEIISLGRKKLKWTYSIKDLQSAEQNYKGGIYNGKDSKYW